MSRQLLLRFNLYCMISKMTDHEALKEINPIYLALEHRLLEADQVQVALAVKQTNGGQPVSAMIARMPEHPSVIRVHAADLHIGISSSGQVYAVRGAITEQGATIELAEEPKDPLVAEAILDCLEQIFIT